MKNKLNITEGKWIAEKYLVSTSSNIDGNVICEAPKLWWRSMQKWKDNAILIADAGTTYNECQILPSELLKQRNELLEMLKLLFDGSNAPDWKKELVIKTLKNCEL